MKNATVLDLIGVNAADITEIVDVKFYGKVYDDIYRDYDPDISPVLEAINKHLITERECVIGELFGGSGYEASVIKENHIGFKYYSLDTFYGVEVPMCPGINKLPVNLIPDEISGYAGPIFDLLFTGVANRSTSYVLDAYAMERHLGVCKNMLRKGGVLQLCAEVAVSVGLNHSEICIHKGRTNLGKERGWLHYWLIDQKPSETQLVNQQYAYLYTKTPSDPRDEFLPVDLDALHVSDVIVNRAWNLNDVRAAVEFVGGFILEQHDPENNIFTLVKK